MRVSNMEVANSHGAVFGNVENDGHHVRFHAKKDWTPGYSAYQLEEIAKTMRKLDKPWWR